MAGARLEKTPKKKSPIPLLILKALYWILFAIALAIVVLYLHFKRPPKVERPAVAAPPPVQVTDDPTTPVDESQTAAGEDPAPAGRKYKENCYTFLVIGMDAGNGNTDTLMVVNYDVDNQHVGVVSIPRDTLMNVPRTIKKVNAAYAAGGVEEVKKEISDLLGIPLDYYIIVDLRGFRSLVDTLGGVDFYVPVNMNYDDPTQDLHIHLSKGMQHINGAQALQLVRFRSGYSNADLGRIQTQQKFLLALAKKLLSWKSVTKINEFAEFFADHVKTDLSVRELGYFGISALDLDTENGVSMGTLPGDGSVTYRGIPYYYQLYPQQTLDLLNEVGMSPYEDPLTLDDLNIFQVK